MRPTQTASASVAHCMLGAIIVSALQQQVVELTLGESICRWMTSNAAAFLL